MPLYLMEESLSSDNLSCLVRWSLVGVLVIGVPGGSVEFGGEEGVRISGFTTISVDLSNCEQHRASLQRL